MLQLVGARKFQQLVCIPKARPRVRKFHPSWPRNCARSFRRLGELKNGLPLEGNNNNARAPLAEATRAAANGHAVFTISFRLVISVEIPGEKAASRGAERHCHLRFYCFLPAGSPSN